MEFIKIKTGTKPYLFGIALILIFSGYWLINQKAFFDFEPSIKIDQKQLEKLKAVKQIMPVVIIGSGPAGLAAGVYTSRAGLPTLIIEGNKPGGLLTETTYIENWPGEAKILGTDLMSKFKQQNQDLGVEFLADRVEQVDFKHWPYQIKTADGHEIQALSVIVATGASPRRLGLPNEQQYWGHGVSSCAVCDAPFFKDKAVVVVGGGDSAIEQVLQLAPHVRNVKMLVRKDVLRASQAMQDKIANLKNAEIIYHTQITQIIGDGTQVTAVQLNQDQLLPIDGIFLAIGHDPASGIFKNQLAIDEQNYLILKPNTQTTSKTGVFAAGEVVDHNYRQAGVAAGDGIKAALEAIRFLQDIGFNQEIKEQLVEQQFKPLKTKKVELLAINSLAEFESILANSTGPVVLDFYTDYCSACLHMLPTYQAVAAELADQISLFKVDADQNYELVQKFNIKRVPTFLIFKQGVLVERIQDVLDKRQMLDVFGKYVA